MSNYKFKITVVTPVFNGEHTILKSIQSLQNQTFKDWCCIIVNDGSTDKTKIILDTLNDERFHIVHFKENKGRPVARQAALELVKTKYMCMLDADDWYYPDKLEMQYKFMESNPTITLMSTAIGVVNKKGHLYNVLAPFNKIKHLSFNKYLDYKMVPHASSIIRVLDIGKVAFNLKLKLGEDQDFMRKLLIGKKYAFVNKITYIYHRDESSSFNKYKNSMNFAIESTNSLPISTFLKAKQFIKFKSKMLIVQFLYLFGFQNWYLNRVGRKPNLKVQDFFTLTKSNIISNDERKIL